MSAQESLKVRYHVRVCLQGVTESQIRNAVHKGAGSLSEVSRRLGVATCCGRNAPKHTGAATPRGHGLRYGPHGTAEAVYRSSLLIERQENTVFELIWTALGLVTLYLVAIPVLAGVRRSDSQPDEDVVLFPTAADFDTVHSQWRERVRVRNLLPA